MSSNLCCKLCGEPLENGHPYKNHSIKLEDYMYKFYPKTDLLTGEKIVFKRDVEGYLLTDFCNKNNLKKYLKSLNIDKQKEYLKDILIRRRKLKGLTKALSQFESRDLMMPAVSYYNKVFNNEYNNLCQSIGLRPIFNYNQELEYDNKRKFEIVIDSRESQPLKFNRNVLIETMNVGDYYSKPMYQKFVCERKNISDWAGTMSKGCERFCRELNRAKELGIYVIMIIESSYSDLQSINYLPHTRHIQASNTFLFKRTRDLFTNFDNFQACAVDGRKTAADLIVKLFKLKNDVQSLDIQYLIDTNSI